MVPDSTFLTYMAGQYATAPEEEYHKTKGECVHYVGLKAGNHYAIVDWNPGTAPHQVGNPEIAPLHVGSPDTAPFHVGSPDTAPHQAIERRLQCCNVVMLPWQQHDSPSMSQCQPLHHHVT